MQLDVVGLLETDLHVGPSFDDLMVHYLIDHSGLSLGIETCEWCSCSVAIYFIITYSCALQHARNRRRPGLREIILDYIRELFQSMNSTVR